MKITIVGGGNIGTQFAIHCSQENDVTIYTSKKGDFIENIKMIDENNNIFLEGKNIKATDDSDEAFLNADLIFVTYPAFKMDEISNIIYPYTKEGLKIGLVPGTGGGECAFKKCVDKGAIVFGLQRVPSVARLIYRGKIVKASGYRKELFVGAIPKKEVNDIAKIIANIFNIKCIPLSNYLNVTLTPSNPILHTTRLRTIFKDYKNGVTYDQIPLFYEEWNDDSSELLLKCDYEVQKICNSINGIDLSNVKSLKSHYESNTKEELTNKMRSIVSLKGLKTPSKLVNDKYIPDLDSRYFTADFPYGLSILIQIGDFLNLNIPYMKDTMKWYRKISNNKIEFSYKNYDIDSLDDLLNFYDK